jgi:hypothetical protein
MGLTALRESVKEQLATELAIDVVSGRVDLEGGVKRRELACVWIETLSRGEAAVIENAEVHARHYLKHVEPRSDEEPADPQPLEEAAEAIRDALKDLRRLMISPTEVWLLRFVGVEFDYESQGVEAVFVAQRESQFET